MAKVINAVFGGGLFATTAKVFQYDVGDKLRFLGVDLPEGYSVDFANSRTGASTTVYGDADGVTIPPEYFIPGTEIYAWVVISDADGHYTRYQAKIPIYERAKRSDVEPTPAQADALDEAINALNSVVENVQDIADNLNEQINTALTEAKESGEFDGEDGFSPTVTVAEIAGGHRVTIYDLEHPAGQSFDVLDGQDASSGSSDYDDLSNKPQIGGVELSGNKTAADLGLAPAGAYVKPSSGIPNSDLAEDAQRGYTSEERVTLVPEGTYTFLADAGDGAGYAYQLDFSSVPDMDFDSPPESVMIVVDGVAYEKQYNASESESYAAAIYGTTGIPTNDCALIIDLNLLRQGITEEAITPIVRLNVMDGEEQHTFSAYFIRQPVTTTPDFDAAVAKSSAEALAGKLDADGDAYRAASIPMGHLDAGSTATVMTATVPGITELRDGVCMWLQNGVITSAENFTININGLGAKPCYSSLAAATRVTTAFSVNYTMLMVYNSTRVTGGCWDIVYGYDTNTTYTPPKLGFGYGTCSTAATTVAKTVSISSYTLTTGGIVAVKFTNAVSAGATLNINSKGAKAIYYKGAAITAGVIKAGDTVTMIYSTYYHVLSIDRDIPSPSDGLPSSVTESIASPGTSTEYARADHVHSISSATVEVLLDEQITSNIDMLVLPSGAADGDAVMLRTSWPGKVFVNYEIMSAHKHIAYFVIPLVANPVNISDFQTVSDASVSKVYVTANGLGLQYNGIADGKLYSAEFVLPFDSDQATGTLSVTDLALPSAQGVSF